MKELYQAIAALYGTGAFELVNYHLNGQGIHELTLMLEEKEMSSLNLGFRFDSEEMAAILVNTTIARKI